MINQYYNHLSFDNTNEQNLYEDLVIESIQNYGMDVYYIPKTLNKLDRIFGEDVLKSFDKTYTIEMYFNTPSNFDGGAFLSEFGYQIGKISSFIVAAKRFTEEYQSSPGVYVRPMEGDLIYSPLTKDLWEITEASHEHIFYQMGKVYVWKLTVEKFQYSSERISTGITKIDEIEDFNTMVLGPTWDITLINGGWGYTTAPTITISGGGGTGATATANIYDGSVISIDIVTNGVGYASTPEVTFSNGVGDTTGHGASAKITLLNSNTDPIDDAELIQTESDAIMNFDEKDPFSMGGEY
jgi:hypothetical protein